MSPVQAAALRLTEAARQEHRLHEHCRHTAQEMRLATDEARTRARGALMGRRQPRKLLIGKTEYRNMAHARRELNIGHQKIIDMIEEGEARYV